MSRQAQRARSFWDASYNSGDDQGRHTEWIVSPGDVLRFLPMHRHRRTFRVLEVGCGDSVLGEAIYDHLTGLGKNREGGVEAAEAATAEEPEDHVSVVCTDISPVTIGRLKARQQREDSKNRRRPGLRYLVADATDLPATFGLTSKGDDRNEGLFDVVVDKGCADTFQFRCKTSESERLLRRLFRSVHAVLRPGGAYLVVTPKKKVKHLRNWGCESTPSKSGVDTSSGINERTAGEGDGGHDSERYTRLGWASQRRHNLGILGSGHIAEKMKMKEKNKTTMRHETAEGDDDTVVSASGGHRVFLHECLKRTAEQEAASSTGDIDLATAEERRDHDDGLPTYCSQCGLERAKSKYKNKKSWSGHLDWCQGPC